MLGWVRRRPVLVAVVVLVVLLRAALPLALERIIADQASQALGAKITVGDVDLALLRGAVALEGCGLFALPPDTPDEAILSDDPPVISFDRLYVNLEWLDLPGQLIGVSRASLEGPIIRLERDEDGEVNLVRLFAHLAGGEEEEPEAESPWRYSLRNVRIKGGKVIFSDQTVEGEPVTVELDELGLDHFVWPLVSAERSGELAVDLYSDGGTLSLRGTIDDAGEGAPQVSARLEATNLRLVTGAAYVERIGWSDLRGLIDLTASYKLVGDSDHRVSVAVTLHDAAVAVPGHDRPPLLWDSLEVTADADLLVPRVDVGKVVLRGASLTVDLEHPVVLPLLGELLAAGEPTDAEGAETEVDAAPAEEAQEADASDVPDAPDAESAQAIQDPQGAEEAQPAPWQWTVADVEIDDAVLHVPTKSGAVDVVLEVSAKGFGSAPNTVSSLHAGLTGPLGDLSVDATGGYQPVGVAGEIAWNGLLLDQIAAILPDETAGEILRSGSSTGKLRLRAGRVGESAEEMPASDTRMLRIDGEIGVSDLQIASDEPAEFALGWKTLFVALDEVVVPRVVPAQDAPPADHFPIEVRLSSISLDGWKARLTRTADGIALPRFGAEKPTPAAGGEAGGEEAATEAPAAAEEEPAAKDSPVATVVIDRLDITKARLSFIDRTLAKPFEAVVTIDRLETTGLGWPELQAASLDGNGKLLKAVIWKISGSYAPAGADIELDFDRIPLLAVSSPAAELTGYEVKRGDLDLDTKVRIESGQLRSDNHVVLRNFSMSAPGGDTTFEDAFGMPLPLVIALLRDPAGNISLSVPVSGGADEVRTGLGTVVAGVLRQAIVGALTSPLKLVGALTTVGEGKIESLDLAHVEFVPARDTLAEGADDRVRALARLLTSRPEVALELRGVITRLDVNVLKQEHVAEALRSGDDLPDVGWLQRRRLRGHVEAMAAGEKTELDEEDAAVYERLLDAAQIGQRKLALLAKARAQKVAEVLLEEYEVDPVQVPIVNTSTDELEPARGRPRVEFDIRGLD